MTAKLLLIGLLCIYIAIGFIGTCLIIFDNFNEDNPDV